VQQGCFELALLHQSLLFAPSWRTIIGASLRKPHRTSLLEPIISQPGPQSRFSIFVSAGYDYIAGYWRAGEQLPKHALESLMER
jgi:hypothetical protein